MYGIRKADLNAARFLEILGIYAEVVDSPERMKKSRTFLEFQHDGAGEIEDLFRDERINGRIELRLGSKVSFNAKLVLKNQGRGHEEVYVAKFDPNDKVGDAEADALAVTFAERFQRWLEENQIATECRD